MSSQAHSDLTAGRAQAIANSGWGRSFDFYQPRNFSFWVYVFLVGTGVLSFLAMLSTSAQAYGEAIVVATVLFGIYGIGIWLFVRHFDRYARQPGKVLVAAVMWGGFAATWAMAANANSALDSLYSKILGQAWAQDWSAALSAPFTEEISKGVGLLLLIALAPRLVRTGFDGFILGAFIGLGFQIIEDIAYALNSAGSQFGANQVQAALGTILLRMILGVAAHTLYSAVFCAGLVYLLGRPAEPRQPAKGLALMASAMLLHGVWDALGVLTNGNDALLLLSFVVVIAVALILVAWVYRTTVPRERAFLREILEPEVVLGVVTQAEVDAMSGGTKARRRYLKTLPSKAIRKRADYVMDAAGDLADELATAGGNTTPQVDFARHEVVRIRSGVPALSRDAAVI